MKSSKNYLNDIGFIRVFACIAILLYHMNILKGGYLLVCTFFVLTGYLSCKSCFNKDKFSFKDYYLNKLKKIYLPLLIVVFISISAISLFPSINWFNLKPETTSVLLGYNNFWQLNANLDYFARHVSSPFMHLWYMGIILQFDLIFPFIYLLFKKMGDKVNKLLPSILLVIITSVFTIIFYISSLDSNIMTTYYHTLTRIFSILFGVSLAFVHYFYKEKTPIIFKNKIINRIVFYTYLVILLLLSIFTSSTSKYYALFMIITTFISTRLISYGLSSTKEKLNIKDKTIKLISDISYEIYLVQYPIIFIFQYIELNIILKSTLIILLTLIISYIIKKALSLKDKKVLKYILLIIVIIPSIIGLYQYITAKDHTKEMKELEAKLSENSKLMEERKKEYIANLKKEQDAWNETMKNLEANEENLKTAISNLSVVGIGDSVMLGALTDLQQRFPNGYFDAAVSRTAWVAKGLIQKLANNNLLGDVIVINLGANGDCDSACKNEIVASIGNRKIFWVTVTNDRDVNVNNSLYEYSKLFNNFYTIDWHIASSNHPEYFVADGIHLTPIGRAAYTNVIYDTIYNTYLNEYKMQKEALIKEHESKQNEKISFIGNSMLINAYENLQVKFPLSEVITNQDYTFDTIKKDLEDKITNNTLSKKVVFVFDNNSYLTKEEYEKLIKLCENYEVYIVTSNTKLDIINSNVKIIDFYQELSTNDNYYMPDRIHLSGTGNKALNDIIEKSLIK